MIFRCTHGRALIHFKPYKIDGVEKAAYLIVFSMPGNVAKVIKICDSFNGQRFEIQDMTQLSMIIYDQRQQVVKAKALLDVSRDQLKDYLFEHNQSQPDSRHSGISTLEVYKWFIAKEKAICNALNMLKLHKHAFVGYFWIPADKVAQLHEKLNEFHTTQITRWVPTDNRKGPVPPTSFKTNDVL